MSILTIKHLCPICRKENGEETIYVSFDKSYSVKQIVSCNVCDCCSEKYLKSGIIRVLKSYRKQYRKQQSVIIPSYDIFSLSEYVTGICVLTNINKLYKSANISISNIKSINQYIEDIERML